MKDFTKLVVNQKIGPSATIDDLTKEIGDEVQSPEFKPYKDQTTLPYVVPKRDILQNFDTYIGAEVMLPIGNQMRTNKVHERKQHANGSKVGISNPNPIFDTCQYIIEFPDGAEKEYIANTIAENVYSQCNPDGEQYLILKSIVDHKQTSKALVKGEEYITHNSRHR